MVSSQQRTQAQKKGRRKEREGKKEEGFVLCLSLRSHQAQKSKAKNSTLLTMEIVLGFRFLGFLLGGDFLGGFPR
jgi:hypothetical protein